MANDIPTTLTPVRRLLRLLGQYRREIRYILLYALVSGLINLSLPLGVQAIIGQIAGGAINASWGVMVFFVLTGALLAGILRLMQLSVMEYLQRKVFLDSALEFALRIPRLNLEALRKEHLPEVVNRFFDTLTLQKGLPKLLIDGSTAVLQIIFSLLLLSFYNSSFVLLSLLLLGIMFMLFYWATPKGLQTSLKESKYKYKLAFWLEELARVAVTFKLAGENNFPLHRADHLTFDYLEARSKHWRILMAKFVGGLAFRLITLGAFLILGSMLVMQNQLNIGQFVASEILVFFVIESVEKLILLYEIGYDVLTAAEKLGQVADLPLERETGIPVNAFSAGNEAFDVELRDLSYQYDDSDQPVLRHLSLKIAPRERVAIAGYNGSGKSTLMQILSVIKSEFTGALLFNGLTSQSLQLRSLREHIGDLSSQEDIFKGTLLENITVGNTYIDLKTVLEVAEAVGLSHFLQHSPAGLETELLPGGSNIPRSIVAKILVARSIVTAPKLLVMEEPTVNLNFRDRLHISQQLTRPNRPWTMVAVTEDPVLAALCDRVLVLKDGAIVFDGDFEAVQKTPHFEKVFKAFHTGAEEI